MNLEPIIQSEVSQKDKDEYSILTHIYGIQKDGTDEFICREAIEKQIQRTDLRKRTGGERVRFMDRVTWKLIYSRIKIDSQWESVI